MQRDSIVPARFGTENGWSLINVLGKSLDVIGVRFPKHNQTVPFGHSMYKITECHESKWKMPLMWKLKKKTVYNVPLQIRLAARAIRIVIKGFFYVVFFRKFFSLLKNGKKSQFNRTLLFESPWLYVWPWSVQIECKWVCVCVYDSQQNLRQMILYVFCVCLFFVLKWDLNSHVKCTGFCVSWNRR